MKRFALSFTFLVFSFPVLAGEAPSYHALDEMQERANAYIAALETQRNDALNQVVQLKAELAKQARECKAR